MNKSKLLKILSLCTLGVGAISGTSVALVSCDSANTAINFSDLKSGTDFKTITINSGQKYDDIVAAINVAITKKWKDWSADQGEIKIYDQADGSRIMKKDFTPLAGKTLWMRISVKTDNNKFTGTSEILAFNICNPVDLSTIDLNSHPFSEISMITAGEKNELNQLNSAINIAVEDKYSAWAGDSKGKVEIFVKPDGTTPAKEEDIINKTSLYMKLTAAYGDVNFKNVSPILKFNLTIEKIDFARDTKLADIITIAIKNDKKTISGIIDSMNSSIQTKYAFYKTEDANVEFFSDSQGTKAIADGDIKDNAKVYVQVKANPNSTNFEGISDILPITIKVQ